MTSTRAENGNQYCHSPAQGMENDSTDFHSLPCFRLARPFRETESGLIMNGGKFELISLLGLNWHSHARMLFLHPNALGIIGILRPSGGEYQ